MGWPADDGSDDLETLLAVVRAGTWLRAPRHAKEAVAFVAGFLAARPAASLDEVGSALRLAGLGPGAWQASRQALEQQPCPRQPIPPYWRRRLLDGGAT